jgi:hypothetical protein
LLLRLVMLLLLLLLLLRQSRWRHGRLALDLCAERRGCRGGCAALRGRRCLAATVGVMRRVRAAARLAVGAARTRTAVARC